MRSQVLVLLLILLASARASAAVTVDSLNVRPETYRWEHRLLLVFAPVDTSEALAMQQKDLEGHDEGFRDRDLLLLFLRDEGEGTLRSAPGGEPRLLTQAAVRRLYDHFDVPPESFRIVLVGKDGTEKRRDTEPVAVRSLFDTIDAMPMRQREMQAHESLDDGE